MTGHINYLMAQSFILFSKKVNQIKLKRKRKSKALNKYLYERK